MIVYETTMDTCPNHTASCERPHYKMGYNSNVTTTGQISKPCKQVTLKHKYREIQWITGSWIWTGTSSRDGVKHVCEYSILPKPLGIVLKNRKTSKTIRIRLYL